MTRTSDPNPVEPLSEPERTLRLLAKRLQEGFVEIPIGEGLEAVPKVKEEMEADGNNNDAERTMYDYAKPSLDGT